MKIPKEIKIGGLTYEIILEDRVAHGVDDSASSLMWQLKIWIDSTQAKEKQFQSLWHEIIEQINDLNDLEMPHSVISTLATSIRQVLMDNKLLK